MQRVSERHSFRTKQGKDLSVNLKTRDGTRRFTEVGTEDLLCRQVAARLVVLSCCADVRAVGTHEASSSGWSGWN